MPLQRVLLAACLLCLGTVAFGYEEDYEVTYDDSYYNEIPLDEKREASPTVPPCQAEEASRWDKLFIMMEDSQMRQNMLLHSLDTVVRAELRALGADLRRVTSGNAAACARAADAVGERLSGKLEQEEERVRKARAAATAKQGVALQQLLDAGRDQAARLDKMEDACLKGVGLVAAMDIQQEPTSGIGGTEVARLEKLLAAMATDLQRVQAQLDASQQLARQNFLPSGCDTALLFPLRSQTINAVVYPDVRMSVRSLTVCLWAKPAQALNRTVLFSYGTRESPREAQLLLSGRAALFVVAGQVHPVEAGGVVQDGQWGHYCGTWSSEQGLASLWVNGQRVSSSPAMTKGHTLPASGVMLLGQEWSDCCGYVNRLPAFDPKLAFAGKITGFGVWDRVLTPEEITQHAQLEGSCGFRGNVVGWGVTNIVPSGGAKYVN